MTIEQIRTHKNQRTPFEDNFCKDFLIQDTLDSIGWAAAFIWAGVVVFLALNFGLGGQGWSLFFLGAGVLVLIEVVVRLLVPEFRRSVFGDLIWTAILFGLGTGSWALIGPLILIAIGVPIFKDINSSQV